MKHTFLSKRFFIFSFLLLFFSFIPLPVISDFVHTTSVKAAEVQDDDDTKVKLNVNSKSLVLDETYDIKVYRSTDNQKISFKSSDSSVVSVKKTDDKEAKITANDIGDAVITVSVKEGFKTVATLKCDISVTPPAVNIKLIVGGKNNKVEITVGDKTYIRYELKPATTSETPRFISSDSDVVTVSSKGVITGISSGHATIYACIDNGKYDLCTVYVTKF